MSGLKFLKPEQKQMWKENGYVKLSNVFTTKEINEISEAYDELFERKRRENVEGLESAWAGNDMKQAAGNIDYTNRIKHPNAVIFFQSLGARCKIQTEQLNRSWTLTSHFVQKTHNSEVNVKSIHNLQMHSATFTRLITNEKLLNALEDVMETNDIVLHHTKAHVKPPEKGAPYLMHQDYHYFPHKKHTMLAVFVHLDDTTPENGGLAVYPGSNKLGPLEDHGLTDEKGEQYHYADPNRFPLSGAIPISAKKGEIVVFSYLLLHGSYLNLSSRARRMFLMQVKAADDDPIADVHKSPCQNLVLRGRNVNREASMANRFAH